jgi:hypothetical protein
MRGLSDQLLIAVWDRGLDRHPVDRALLLLAQAFPDQEPSKLASLTVGQRNARLLELRRRTFGPQLNGIARCPQCNETLEFRVDSTTLHVPEPEALEYTLTVDGLALQFRLLNSLDLAAIAHLRDVSTARQHLVERCVFQALHNEEAVPISELSERAIRTLGDVVAECDPQAEMVFTLECAACQHHWTLALDIVSFFWAEIDAYAQRLLYEISTLARTYGWSESEILSMNRRRRQLYLELAENG